MKHQLDATLCRFHFCTHSTCYGLKRPSPGVFKTSTAATGTCVMVAGKSSHLLIRAGTEWIQLKLVRRPLVHVLSLQVSHHISILGPELNAFSSGPNKEM